MHTWFYQQLFESKMCLFMGNVVVIEVMHEFVLDIPSLYYIRPFKTLCETIVISRLIYSANCRGKLL